MLPGINQIQNFKKRFAPIGQTFTIKSRYGMEPVDEE